MSFPFQIHFLSPFLFISGKDYMFQLNAILVEVQVPCEVLWQLACRSQQITYSILGILAHGYRFTTMRAKSKLLCH